MDTEKEKYQNILDSVFCSILIFNNSGLLIHCNASARSFFKRMAIDIEQFLKTPFTLFSKSLTKQINITTGQGRFTISLKGLPVICNLTPWMSRGRRCGTVIILHESLHPDCVTQELDVTMGLLQEINTIVDSSHDGILVVDHENNIIRVNTAFEKAFSVARKNIIGKKIQQMIAETGIPQSAALHVLKTKKSASVAVEMKGKQLISTGEPVFDDNGDLTAVVVNVRDITLLNEMRSDLEHHRMVAEGYSRELAREQSRNTSKLGIIAASKEMTVIMDTIQTIADVDSTVLITGESGTGKEVVVNQIYQTSLRKDKPIIKINCGAIPEALFESELFGYEEGAFTGARRKGKAGFFELANGGTLFLDEIGELKPDLQVKLLRVIQEGEITRIGGTKTIHADVRLIAATNQDLWTLVQQKQFRADLYYRLNVIHLEVPPLRNRRDDIIPLSIYFVDRFNQKYKKKKQLSMELGRVLRAQDWPGNIRELQNLMESLVVLAPHDTLRVSDLPSYYLHSEGKAISDTDAGVLVTGVLPLREAENQLMAQLLANAKKKYTTNKEIARALEVDPSTISRKLHAFMHK